MKNLRVVVWLLIIGAAVYVGWRIVPPYMANARFSESIDDSARSAAVNSQSTEDEIRFAVLRNAQDLEIPLKPEDIRVERNGGNVFISADYTVHIDLPVHPIDLQFHPSSKRESLSFR